MIADPRQHLGKPSPRVDVIKPGGDDEPVDGSSTLATAVGASQTARPCVQPPSPVHSAHVGEQLKVHYRWHPYYGSKVSVRCVEQRVTGQFLRVLGPAGVVVSIAGWMLDPIICGGMVMGAPRPELAALIELSRLLIGADNAADSRNDGAIVREEGN